MGGVTRLESGVGRPDSWLAGHILRWLLSVAAAAVYFFSNPNPQSYYDYTFRVAENFLRGSIGFAEKRPPWLNEFVPFEGEWYSVFPLGAVVSMIPEAALKIAGIVTQMPGAWVAAILAGIICYFLLSIAEKYDTSATRRILLTFAILFGTFMWTNLTFAGAWQLALGFAMVGQLGAIYFTVYDRRPLLAGLFFALAFGNRTENLLTAPVFMYLLCRAEEPEKLSLGEEEKGSGTEAVKTGFQGASPFKIRDLSLFCAVPFVLGISTLIYNYVRFHSFTDFGYSRIPGVLDEPWYNHGIFSVWYLFRQAWEMLFKMWNWSETFPYIVPDGFSSSILFSSPFLLLIFRRGARDRVLKLASWFSIVILTFLHWTHGNSGGWQFGYRYAMVLLPWIFVIMLENGKRHLTPLEWSLIGLSFVANAYATWVFHWTNYLERWISGDV
ncbi:MAG: hypothetical protein IPK01_10320 [Acidobacteria bacterium]|nr:hypothetical protein [Acidobacteriota bacterium]